MNALFSCFLSFFPFFHASEVSISPLSRNLPCFQGRRCSKDLVGPTLTFIHLWDVVSGKKGTFFLSLSPTKKRAVSRQEEAPQLLRPQALSPDLSFSLNDSPDPLSIHPGKAFSSSSVSFFFFLCGALLPALACKDL